MPVEAATYQPVETLPSRGEPSFLRPLASKGVPKRTARAATQSSGDHVTRPSPFEQNHSRETEISSRSLCRVVPSAVTASNAPKTSPYIRTQYGRLKLAGPGLSSYAVPPQGLRKTMYLTGLVQRERLFDITMRWFSDRPEADDARFLTELLLFERRISGPTVQAFVREALALAGVSGPRAERIRTKDALREAIIATCRRPSEREAELFARYRARPEEFFPRTPADIELIWDADDRLVALSRYKRIRRIAEKASRRVADALSEMIEEAAAHLAQERARLRKITLEQLQSSPDEMRGDFERAERLVADAFRDGLVGLVREEMVIDDVVGMKLILPEAAHDELAERLDALDGVSIFACERHRGRYNDTNLLVDLTLPPAETIIERTLVEGWSGGAERGFSDVELAAGFPEFVRSGAREIRTELILASQEELIESEFGRSIHEERILQQRRSRPYSGRIAKNASFLIEYLLRVADSPCTRIGHLPIKMWGRYLGETFSADVAALYGIERRVSLAETHDSTLEPAPNEP